MGGTEEWRRRLPNSIHLWPSFAVYCSKFHHTGYSTVAIQ